MTESAEPDSEEHEEWERWLRAIRDGDDAACQKLWDDYGPLIERVATKHLSPGVRRRVGPETVMLSACRTFFRRAQEGEFEIADSESLWRLLCGITVNKARLKIRHHQRQRRALDREIAPDASRESAGGDWTPADEVAFADQLQHLLAQFSETEQRIVELRLQQMTLREIAEEVESSERTVRRLNKRIEHRLQAMFELETP